MFRLKNENALAKLGLRLDPTDPTKIVRLDGQGATSAEVVRCDAAQERNGPGHNGAPAPVSQPNTKPEVSQPAEADPPYTPIVLSFCTGAMGLDLGLEQAGLSIRLAAEIDPAARETIRKNRPNLPLVGDIRECTAPQVREAAGIGDADIAVVAAGVPCQSFSTAGSRQGLDDPRGELILRLAELAAALSPAYVVIENVRGLLSAEEGTVLTKVLKTLRDGGYFVSFNLYDAANFGVPQRRERVILIGSRTGRVPYLTPTHCGEPEGGLPAWKTLWDAIGDMVGVEHHHFDFPDRRLEYFRKLKPGQDWRHLSDEDQKAAMNEAAREAAGGKTGFFRRLAWDKPCPTLVTRPDMPATDLCHPDEDRPLSIEEYKRIQGIPDTWELCGDIASRYRQLGNAVPVALGKAIGLTILEHIRTQGSEDPSPGFKYSRYTGTSDRDWCAVDAAKARLAEIAPKVRRINKQTRKSLLVTIRNVLPRVRIAGRLLIEAKSLCRRCKILWLPWVRQTCRMSKRSAQAYMRIARNWKAIVEAQRSAPLTSIDAVLTFLAQPKDKPKTATGENGHGAGAGGGVDGHHADDAPAATTSSLKGSGTNGNTAVPAGATAATEPASGGDPPDITPERRRELEVALKDLVRRRDRRTREIFPLVAELVSGLAADVQVGEWDKEDRRNLSKVTDRMTASLAGIKSTLASWQPPSDSARR